MQRSSFFELGDPDAKKTKTRTRNKQGSTCGCSMRRLKPEPGQSEAHSACWPGCAHLDRRCCICRGPPGSQVELLRLAQMLAPASLPHPGRFASCQSACAGVCLGTTISGANIWHYYLYSEIYTIYGKYINIWLLLFVPGEKHLPAHGNAPQESTYIEGNWIFCSCIFHFFCSHN